MDYEALSVEELEELSLHRLTPTERALASGQLAGRLTKVKADIAQRQVKYEENGGQPGAQAARNLARLEREAAAITAALDRAEQFETEMRRIPLGDNDAPRVKVGAEPGIYRPGGEHSIVRDMFLSEKRGEPLARERLERHQREMAVEYRDAGTAAFTGLVVPAYLTDMYAPKLRAQRPFLDSIRNEPLPPGGMTVELSRITTGTTVAAQATEGGAVSETDIDDTLLSIDVRTYAGQQDLSRQAVERGTLVDAVVFRDLMADYNAKVDAAALNGAGTSGTHLGVLQTTGTNAVTYTSASPTVKELYPKIADAAQQVSSAFFGADLICMHPRRWGWILSKSDTTDRPLVVPNVSAPTNAIGTVSAPGGYGIVGQIMGLGVVTDGNIPTTLGTGTNEDAIIVCSSEEVFVFEDPSGPKMLRFDEVLSGTLQIRLQVYGYSAFTAGRQPTAISKITGTGLSTPSFA